MTWELMVLELRRGRWRRARQSLHLLDPSAEDFGTEGLASFVANRSVRLLILPADPEASLIEFDEGLWEWWRQAHTDPVTGDPTQWGTQHRTISAAVVSYDSYREQGWERYRALYRHGGLELELGSSATYTFGERRGFRLIYTVGNIWAALSLYQEVEEKFGVEGPWEVTLAIQHTEGSVLGNLGEGWAPPESLINDPPICLEPGVLLRQETADWPSGAEVQALAFTVGGWIDNSWGGQGRRFLARQGPLAEEFDWRQYPRQ